MKNNIMIILAMMLFSCENSIEKVKQFIDTDTINGVLAYDVTITRSDSGFVQAKLMTQVMHNKKGEKAVLEFPKGFCAFIYERDTLPISKITANYGIRYNEKELVFARDNVIVENIKTQEILYTETLYWNQKTKKIYTNNFVKITTPDKVIFGDSLTANEDFSQRVIHGIRATLELDEDEVL